jgi:hypothetical protein
MIWSVSVVIKLLDECPRNWGSVSAKPIRIETVRNTVPLICSVRIPLNIL